MGDPAGEPCALCVLRDDLRVAVDKALHGLSDARVPLTAGVNGVLNAMMDEYVLRLATACDQSPHDGARLRSVSLEMSQTVLAVKFDAMTTASRVTTQEVGHG